MNSTLDFCNINLLPSVQDYKCTNNNRNNMDHNNLNCNKGDGIFLFWKNSNNRNCHMNYRHNNNC